MANDEHTASPNVHMVVNLITYLGLVAGLTAGVASLLSWPWWVALIVGVLVLVLGFGIIGDRLVPRITGPIIDGIAAARNRG